MNYTSLTHVSSSNASTFLLVKSASLNGEKKKKKIEISSAWYVYDILFESLT